MGLKYKDWLNNHKKIWGKITAEQENFGILVWDAAQNAARKENRNRAASAQIKLMCCKCKWYRVKGGSVNCVPNDRAKCFVSAW